MSAGEYKLLISLERDNDESDEIYIGYVDVASKQRVLGSLPIYLNKTLHGPTQFYMNFEVPADEIDKALYETRFYSSGEVNFKIRSIAIAPRDSAVPMPAPVNIVNDDWLHYLALNPFSYINEQGIYVANGQSGLVVSGPCWPLQAGEYELVAEIAFVRRTARPRLIGRAEVTAFAGTLTVASTEIWTSEPKIGFFGPLRYQLLKAVRPMRPPLKKMSSQIEKVLNSWRAPLRKWRTPVRKISNISRLCIDWYRLTGERKFDGQSLVLQLFLLASRYILTCA